MKPETPASKSMTGVEKNHCLNVWKGIAAFAIVLIHCSFPSPVGGMMNGLARFGVPLFFMISGFFTYGKGMDTIKRRSQKCWRLFLTANGVYFLWKLADFFVTGELTSKAVLGLFSPQRLLNWILWNQSPFMGHLWFLGALLYCYLFYGILVKKDWQERCYILIPVCLAANLLLGEGLSMVGRKISFLWVRNFWLTGLPFFLLGHWFAREQEKGRLRFYPGISIALLIIGAVSSMGEMLLSGGSELYLGSILMAVGSFSLALWKPSFGKGSLLAHIGEKAALHIYLWQMIVFDVTAALAHLCGVSEHMVYQWVMPLWVGIVSWLLAEGLLGVKRLSGIKKGAVKNEQRGIG